MIEEFKLSDIEEIAAEAFKKEHRNCAKEHPTTIGGYLTYMFTPTSLGVGKIIKCNICGEKQNITDYDSW